MDANDNEFEDMSIKVQGLGLRYLESHHEARHSFVNSCVDTLVKALGGPRVK